MSNRYVCQAISGVINPNEGEMTRAGTPRSPDVVVDLMVVEGPETGRVIKWFGSLHDNAQKYTAEALRAMGWNCNDITALTGLGSIKVIAIEKQETFEGKTKTRYMIFPVRTPKPTLEADAAASFAARYKALAASVAPVELTSVNAGIPVDQLPAARTTTTATTTTSNNGVGAAGVPF